jgi:hypothetical protein
VVILATVFLTERLMKAAESHLFHGERIEIHYVGPGQRRTCLLLGRGNHPRTVRLGVWVQGNEIREGRRGIKFTDCLLPQSTQALLERTARAQERASGETIDGAELARAIAFIRTVKQRRRNGQFADCTQRAERKGTR